MNNNKKTHQGFKSFYQHTCSPQQLEQLRGGTTTNLVTKPQTHRSTLKQTLSQGWGGTSLNA
ncbi:hypothetical protein [Microscilla marina]|uniref:hypothetical protein n=1 Tax=Microscilla marina TaxID=1027 RepID=UPI00031F6DA3|nr:hypothetical protein [Microscilla marina]